MLKFKTIASNEVISIIQFENGNCFVSNSVLFKSDLLGFEKHFSLFEQVLSKTNEPILGKATAYKKGQDVFGVVDGVVEIKFSHNSNIGWYIANSSAMPKNVGAAKAYLEAIKMAYAIVQQNSTNKREHSSTEEIKRYRSEMFETNGKGELNIEGKIDGVMVYKATLKGDTWQFSIVGNVCSDPVWMNELSKLIKKVNDYVKHLKIYRLPS